LIDTDAATNGLTLFYLGQVNEAKRKIAGAPQAKLSGTFDVRGGFDVVSVENNVDLLPASYVMSRTEEVAIEDFRDRLAAAKVSVAKDYDYVICDAQAGSDLFALVAIEASDAVVIVSEYDPVSAEGVERLRRMFGNIPAIANSWVLFNKVLPDFATELGEFLSVARYLPPVPWDASVIRAFTRRQLALDLERGNAYTVSILGVARTLFVELEREIDAWRGSREALLKAPVIEQVKRIQVELQATENAVRELATLRARQTRNYTIVSAFTAAALLIGGGSAVLAFSRSSGQILTFVVYITVLGGLLMLVTVLVPLWMVQSYRRDDRAKLDLEAQLKELERRAAELREDQAKYETIANADFKSLIKSHLASR
jgi:cellulose biosynthesis protein BcsQ